MAYDDTPSTEPPALPDTAYTWHRLVDADEVPVGRVTTRTIGHRTLAVTNVDGNVAALDNKCPHQGGPLGEGSIENGWLRCPWHGYDYSPCNGLPPGGFSDAPAAFRTDARDDGVWVALPDEPEREPTVSDLMVATMTAWGVSHVFGMVGHSNLGFADAMREAERRGELTYVGIRHEGAAAFAASAYGKLTGELAACFAIAGPGSTNLLTGLYDANVDRAPVLALSGHVPSKEAGRGAFQDLDLEAAFADVATFSTTVRAGSDHAELMTLACKHALDAGGVGHLVLPDEVQNLPAGSGTASGPDGRRADRSIAPAAGPLADAVSRIAAAERPVFVVGHGARNDMGAVIELAERLGAPVITTFKAKGQISDHHPLGGGVLGRSGTPVASWFMNESDLLVVWGASFSNHTGIAPYKDLIQVDRDPAALGRFHPVTVPVQGDIGVTASIVLAALDGRDDIAAVDQRDEVAQRWEIWRAEKTSRLDDDRGEGLASAVVFDALSRIVPADAVVPVDVGNNTYSFGRYFECREQSVIMSGYLGSIGFALPAAMGAWAAVGASGRKVVSISGDGGLGQYLTEVTTLVRHDMDVTHVVLVNGELGKISKEQRAGSWDVWQTSLVNPNFAEYATSCGALGIRVTSRDDLDAALERAIAHEGPALVELITDGTLI